MTVPPNLKWPRLGNNRGPGFWSRFGNLFSSRRTLRSDRSNEWRYEFLRESTEPPPPVGCDPDPAARSRTVDWLLGRSQVTRFRCLILGDTGEGDYSQYGTLPVIRALDPDFLIINGDVAYPAGTDEDYEEGFFRPYAGLGMPIWAVPGNHDYYSKHRGREFHQIFCTEMRRARWDAAGVRLRPQPGTYWELRASDQPAGLVLLGLDTGQSADLEGRRDGWRFLAGKHQPPDDRQHDWLEWRLRRAQEEGSPVIVLYHIPALVREEHVGKTRLDTLHRLIARYPCVRVAVTAHEHNFQQYAAATFGRYLDKQYKASTRTPPEYVVAGASGAYLSSTDFTAGTKTGFKTDLRYPKADDWEEWAGIGLKLVASQKLGRGVLNALVGALVSLKPGIAEESDADRPARLSLLVLDYDAAAPPGARTTLQPCFIDDLTEMYNHLPLGTPIDVRTGSPAVDPNALARCLRAAPIRC